jgi:hypothetical protein
VVFKFFFFFKKEKDNQFHIGKKVLKLLKKNCIQTTNCVLFCDLRNLAPIFLKKKRIKNHKSWKDSWRSNSEILDLA